MQARIVESQKDYTLGGPDKHTYRLLGEKEKVQIQICIQNEISLRPVLQDRRLR